MPRYWWVNHKQTVRQEVDGQYLWSPKMARGKDGARRNVFYDNMRRATPGDLVLSYANGQIGFVGRIAEFAFTAPKPSEFGKTGANWSDEGWLLPVFWVPLEHPIRPRNFLDALAPLLPSRYSPIRPETGMGNQGVYLAEIPEGVYREVAARVSFSHEALRQGGANSLTYGNVRDWIEEQMVLRLERDPHLDQTTKRSVIQARRGQGQFRTSVGAIEPACRVTGVTNPSLLIASHIKPWRVCRSAEERLDGMNGLMLTPDVDLLFDRGFITFEDSGRTRTSERIDSGDLRRLGLQQLTLDDLGFSEVSAPWETRAFAPRQREYLAYHRSEVFVS